MLDQPPAGLSEEEADGLLDLVLAHGHETGMTCVLVEHDGALVMHYATTIAVLCAGRLLAVGGPEEIQKNPATCSPTRAGRSRSWCCRETSSAPSYPLRPPERTRQLRDA
ncbi:MAG: hypothetical protein JWP66_1149 [Naasia sp.]|nr:hypothetical protein [Naasia sp.]